MKRTKRHGNVLVLFVMLFFGLMALAALVIDIGFARLTQCQMQTAVNSAALEGLRWRDYSTDEYRRQQASQVVADGPVGNGSSAPPSMFAEYVDSGGTVQYGAGPEVNFSGGVGSAELAAGQTMTLPNPPVYLPTRADGTPGLELNLSNATEGDMSSGSYGFNPGYDSALSADEDAEYNRRDFEPAALSASSTGSAFLVRMRRTNNIGGLDQEPGISSGGPPLPILFGRGSLMARSGSGSQLSVASGVTVRATAIAAAMPAKSVGPAYSTAGGTVTAIPQLAPFALRSDVWTQVVKLSGTASLTFNPFAANSGVQLVALSLSSSLTAIGQQLAPPTTNDSTLSQGPQATAYVLPVYADLPSQSATIVGFASYIQWSYTPASNGQPPSLTLNAPIASARVGSQNISGTMVLTLPTGISQSDVDTLFQTNESLATDPNYQPFTLYAPVLVDHYLGPN